MSLTADLKKEHRQLVAGVKDFRTSIPSSTDAELAAKLAGIKEALVGHLTREDRELYPAAIAAARSARDKDALERLQGFSRTMANITAKVVAVLGRYDDTDALSNRDRLADDWRGISASLKVRIAFEETGLYPMYDELVGRS